jgi:hypothetical protein
MSKKGGNFFEVYIEAHIEKIIVGVAGVVCAWLLITRVLISPSYVEYDGKKFAVGNIDRHISKQADLLREKLERKPESAQQYEPQIDNFIAHLEMPFKNVDDGIYFPTPASRAAIEIGYGKKYRLPLVGNVSEISAGYIRAAVYMPTQTVDEENTYDTVEHEPNDLDFVTVEAKFDLALLYENFQKSFNGTAVPEEWRDPCLANPVFAAVQLERQELGADDNWSNWEIVPRTRIDHHREIFEVIEYIDELPPGGIKVRLLRFDNPQIRMNLLQPVTYAIASAQEQWYPPSLHKKFMKYQADVKTQERRAELEAKRQEREKQIEERRRRALASRPRQRPTGGAMGEMGMEDIMSEGTGMGTRTLQGLIRPGSGQVRPGDRRSDREGIRTQRKKEREAAESISLQDIDRELQNILLTENTEVGKMREALVFWAHDDTVEPEKTYRYRLRLGVFNPIAGTEQLVEQDEWQKDKVILWSEFSESSEAIEIPPRLCFFAQEIQEAAKTVTVTVSRYVLGYWYSAEFMVKAGETIGSVLGLEPLDSQEQLTVPEQIDYTTGAVLIDVAQVDDWSGGTNPYKRQYYNLLYSFDGTSVERMAVKQRYWPEKLQARYIEIRKLEKEPKQPLRPFGSKVGERRRGPTPGMEGAEDMRRMMEEMIMGRP